MLVVLVRCIANACLTRTIGGWFDRSRSRTCAVQRSLPRCARHRIKRKNSRIAHFRDLFDVRFLRLAPISGWRSPGCDCAQGRELKRFFLTGHSFRRVIRYREVCGNGVKEAAITQPLFGARVRSTHREAKGIFCPLSFSRYTELARNAKCVSPRRRVTPRRRVVSRNKESYRTCALSSRLPQRLSTRAFFITWKRSWWANDRSFDLGLN